jgi:predicted Zn-dependent peptidase
MQDSQVAYSSKFSASLAVDQTQELVNPRHVSLMAGHDFASELTNQEILTMWHRIRRQSNKIYVMVGGFSREEFTAVQTAAQRLSPQTLDAIQPEQKAQTVAFEHRELLQPFAIARAKGPFAAIRTYRGPRSNELRDLMALSALNVVTSNRLQTQNRADQGLGYIHTSLVSPMDEHFSYFSLLGQTTSPEDVQLTIAGWARVLEQIRSEEIPDDELAQGLQAVRTSLQKKSFSSRGLLAEYMQNQFRYGDAKVRTHALGELNTLTPVDVRATAQKYLLAPNTPYLQVVYGDCETLLSGH